MDNSTISNQTERVIVTIIVGMMVIVLAILASIVFEFGIVGNLVTSWILTTAYALFAFFMIEPTIKINPIRYIDRPIQTEVIREVPIEVIKPIQIPMENKTIEVVEKPVIQEVIKEVPIEVEKKVIRYIERKHRKLNIPKFKFMGSTQTRTFHKRTCKFSKMLKNKYKLHSNRKSFFKKKHYHACKSCIIKSKK